MIPSDADIACFVAGEVSPEGFRHAEHVAMAFAMLSRDRFPEAACRFAHGIGAMAVKAGKPEAYHATITIAFLALVAERIAAFPRIDFDRFAADNRDLFDKRILERHYSQARLASPTARATFILPDRIAA